ncbi:MAG: hypothetical protein PHD51_02095 [Patescibacteria group bacterium]|nr:hypothetical protein [Patescibacteria group bacterium]MDD5490348.1 hypothetical protein [Patescibacteria group bacterium]
MKEKPQERPELNPSPEFDVGQECERAGFKIEDYPDLAERLTELNQTEYPHFKDAVIMSRIIKALAQPLNEKLRLNLSPQKLEITALLHDIGKSGPADANSEERLFVAGVMFNNKKFTGMKELTIKEALKREKIKLSPSGGSFFTRLGIDIGKEKMQEFWARHIYWTYDILKENKILEKGKSKWLDEEIINTAASHHLLEGHNPAKINLEEGHGGAAAIESIDRYQLLILVDKYQAFRERSSQTHEEAIKILKFLINQKLSDGIITPKMHETYTTILDLLNKEKDKIIPLVFP